MNKKQISYLLASCMLLAIPGVSFSQNGQKVLKEEKFEMQVEEGEIIPFNKIQQQKPLTISERNSKEKNRGGAMALIVSKGIEGIQHMIDNRKKRYISEYSFARKNESFYDQISTLGKFDPTGIRFSGFTIARIGKGEDGLPDTAFMARFIIDDSEDKLDEMMNNGIFRLRLESFMLTGARVKVPEKERKLNMDFEISFLSSYIGENGDMNKDVMLGKFIYSIRNAPLDQTDPGYKTYYANLPKKNPDCIGYSFLIPRSAGYYINADTHKLEHCFGQGLYSIKIAVKETSKNNFIDKVIMTGSDDILTLGNAALVKKYGSAPASVSKN